MQETPEKASKKEQVASSEAILKEANTLLNLSHPNVLRAFGVIVADDYSVAKGIMTEFMPGGSLTATLERLAE